MSRSRRHERVREEGTLPERPRLTPPPDFPPRVVTEMEPTNEPVLYRTPYLYGPTGYMHVLVSHFAQLTCVHEWGTASRFGDAWCATCGAQAWSKWWVAEGIYGLESALGCPEFDGTGEWLATTAAQWERRAMQAVDPGPSLVTKEDGS